MLPDLARGGLERRQQQQLRQVQEGFDEAPKALAGVRRGSWSLLEPLQVFGRVAGALADPWRGCWCLRRVSTRVLVPSQGFGEGSGVCRWRWRLWRKEKRRKERGGNLGLGF